MIAVSRLDGTAWHELEDIELYIYASVKWKEAIAYTNAFSYDNSTSHNPNNIWFIYFKIVSWLYQIFYSLEQNQKDKKKLLYRVLPAIIVKRWLDHYCVSSFYLFYAIMQ